MRNSEKTLTETAKPQPKISQGSFHEQKLFKMSANQGCY